jgi:hypothetical protein
MSLPELHALMPLRRFRETQAERRWQQQRVILQQAQDAVIAARHRLHQLRQQQREQYLALDAAHRGQALSSQQLNAWRAQEQRQAANLAEHMSALKSLEDQLAQHTRDFEAATGELHLRRRAVEKLDAMLENLTEAHNDEQ